MVRVECVFPGCGFVVCVAPITPSAGKRVLGEESAVGGAGDGEAGEV